MALISPIDSRRPSPLRPSSSAHFAYENHAPPVNAVVVHPILHKNRVAVITGASSGIGRAAAIEFAKLGMKLALADVDEQGLKEAGEEVSNIVGKDNVLVVPTDVSKIDEVIRLREKVYEHWDEVAFLMNNAGIGLKGTSWDGLDAWHKIFDVNLFGILNVQQEFVPHMIHQENDAAIMNTGSKQGITNPPGNAAYNASKAAVKSLTEGLSHELRNTPNANVTAHLFIPGWTFTGITAAKGGEKPFGAWTAQETVLYMIHEFNKDQFYILVPDNETRKPVDQLRIMWAAGDVTEGRPALSRWHPYYQNLFEEYMKDGLAQLDAN